MGSAPVLAQHLYEPKSEAHVWRRFRPVITRQLHCGILLSARGIENWAASLLALLNADPAIAVDAVFVLDGADKKENDRGGWLFQLLQAWSNRSAAPFARQSIVLPSGLSEVALRLQSGSLAPEDAARLAGCRLDLLLSLESQPLPVDCSSLARQGVWSICCGDPSRPRSHPPYWNEAWNKEAVSTAVIRQHLPGGTRNLASCQVATHPGIRFTENAVAPLELAGQALLRRLMDLLEDERSLTALPPQADQTNDRRPPGSLAAAAFLRGQILRSASLRLEARGRKQQWRVALRDRSSRFGSQSSRFSADGFRWLPAPQGCGYADPFVVEHQNRHWLFVEEISPTGKGRLACQEIRANGEVGEASIILEKPYHLSYPHVFSHQGDYFMVPESCGNETVDLYRATRFPGEWTLEQTLCPGVAAVDTTVLPLEGVWYFFTTSAWLGNETFLFWSDRLDGSWHYHPANPICSDARRARSAGALFYSGADLIRPAQDCSVCYGYAVVLNRVKRISKTEYEEEPIETILPTCQPGLLATHTLNSNAAYEVMDGVRYVR
jgi:hypothetical protein